MVREVGIARILKYTVLSVWELLFRIIPFSPLRVMWMNIGGAHISWSAIIDRIYFANLDRTGLSGLVIGKKAFVGVATIIDLAGFVTVEDSATVSPGVAILSHLSVGFSDHPLLRFYPKVVKHTVIKSGSFIGTHSTVLPGVTIGKRSMIGAGSVVTKTIPNDTLAFGVPARVVKKLL